jgi:signal recognition particle subunit SRP54
MFESLSERLESAFKVLSGNNRITELNVAESVKEIRRALVAADVNYKIAKDFTDRVKDKALGVENVLKNVNPGQLMVKIVQDELTALMGGQSAGINVKGSPAIVLIAGLQGSGKTTFSGKLARYLKENRKLSPLLVACDVYRPAAITQLTVLGDSIGVEVYKEPENKNPLEIAQNALKHAKAKGFNVLIVDTAGRLAVDEAMMDEVARLKSGVGHRRPARQPLDHGKQQVGVGVALGSVQHVMHIRQGGGHPHRAHMGGALVSPQRQLHGCDS